MKKVAISNFTDDFLKGSVTVYNYNPIQGKDYLLYCQIAGIQKTGPSYYNELQGYPNYMINYTISGEGLFYADGAETHIEKGDLIFIQNANHHILKKEENREWEFCFVHIFESPLISQLYREFINRFGFVAKGVDEKKILPYITKIIKLLKDKKTDHETRVSSLLYSMLVNILASADDFYTEKIDPSISGVVSFLKGNFQRQLTLDEILEHSRYSKNHTERLFKEKMHMTMQDYLASLRLRRAEELLLTTDLLLKEVAEMVGLGEYRALHYLFIKNLMCTPSEFRNGGKQE